MARNKHFVGVCIPFKESTLKVQGQVIYTGDLKLNHMLYAKLLLSTVPHGLIKSIDTLEAEKVPGVVGVFTYLNTPRVLFNSYIWYLGQDEIKDEYILTDKVRYIGDRVAVVVAKTREIASRAVRKIKVDYEKLPVITDMEEALKPGEVSIHEMGNLAGREEFCTGKIEKIINPNEQVIVDHISTSRCHHAAMETHVCVAQCSADGNITIWTPCQSVYAVRGTVAEVLGLSLNKIRVIKMPTGGSFGGKQEVLFEPLTAFLAQATGKPVQLSLDRRESILTTRTRTVTDTKIKSSVSKEGRILSREINMTINAGAYTSNSRAIAQSMGKKFFKIYKIPNMHYSARVVYTNTPVAGGMRAWGSPQVCAVNEIHMDSIARKLGLDPVDIRLKNLVHPSEKDPLTGLSLGNARVIDCLEMGAREFDWYRKKQRPKGNGRYLHGVGAACGSHPISYFQIEHDLTTMTLSMHEDGSLTLNTGVHDLGCGLTTTLAQIVAEVFGIDLDLITVLEADTERGHYDIGTFASRNTYVAGNCALQAAQRLKDLFLREAAIIFQVPQEFVDMVNGMVWIKGHEHSGKTYREMAMKILYQNQVDLTVLVTNRPDRLPVGYCAHLAEVEVDTYTGQVKIIDYVAVHDVGRALNPATVKGQIYGGIQMGIGYALSEAIHITKEGIPLNDSFKNYQIVNAPDMPKVRAFLIEEGEEGGPFGAKSVGEITVVPVAPAIINAVNDALKTNFSSLPLTPAKIMAGLTEKGMLTNELRI